MLCPCLAQNFFLTIQFNIVGAVEKSFKVAERFSVFWKLEFEVVKTLFLGLHFEVSGYNNSHYVYSCFWVYVYMHAFCAYQFHTCKMLLMYILLMK